MTFYDYIYTFPCFLRRLLEESGTSSKRRFDALSRRSPARALGARGSPWDAPTGCPPSQSPLQPMLGPAGNGASCRGSGHWGGGGGISKTISLMVIHGLMGARSHQHPSWPSPPRWGPVFVRSSCPPQKMGALFMLLRTEDAKQICSLLQLVPPKLPGTFPCRGTNSCGRGRTQHPERSCTNDNILAMFILLLQGRIFFNLFSEP